MSQKDPTVLSSSLRLPPLSARSHSRSPSRSPERQAHFAAHELDPLLRNLSPQSTLEALSATDVVTTNEKKGQDVLAKSIAQASEAERALGIRAAVAGQKLREWHAEISGWEWPDNRGEKLGKGFQPPHTVTNGRQEAATSSLPADMVSGGEEYMGSLPARVVEHYEERIDEIKDGMEALGVEEQKEHALNAHIRSRSRPTSQNGPLSESPQPLTYVQLRDFTAVVTATILQALPFLSRLNVLLNTWDVRLAVLRQVPDLMHGLETTRLAIDKAWHDITNDGDSKFTKEKLQALRSSIEDNVSILGSRLDALLDALEGRQDTLPEIWIDEMEAIETDFGNWVVEAERKVLENEWKTRLRKEQEFHAVSQNQRQEDVRSTISEVERGASEPPGVPSSSESPIEDVSAHKRTPTTFTTGQVQETSHEDFALDPAIGVDTSIDSNFHDRQGFSVEHDQSQQVAAEHSYPEGYHKSGSPKQNTAEEHRSIGPSLGPAPPSSNVSDSTPSHTRPQVIEDHDTVLNEIQSGTRNVSSQDAKESPLITMMSATLGNGINGNSVPEAPEAYTSLSNQELPIQSKHVVVGSDNATSDSTNPSEVVSLPIGTPSQQSVRGEGSKQEDIAEQPVSEVPHIQGPGARILPVRGGTNSTSQPDDAGREAQKADLTDISGTEEDPRGVNVADFASLLRSDLPADADPAATSSSTKVDSVATGTETTESSTALPLSSAEKSVEPNESREIPVKRLDTSDEAVLTVLNQSDLFQSAAPETVNEHEDQVLDSSRANGPHERLKLDTGPSLESTWAQSFGSIVHPKVEESTLSTEAPTALTEERINESQSPRAPAQTGTEQHRQPNHRPVRLDLSRPNHRRQVSESSVSGSDTSDYLSGLSTPEIRDASIAESHGSPVVVHSPFNTFGKDHFSPGSPSRTDSQRTIRPKSMFQPGEGVVAPTASGLSQHTRASSVPEASVPYGDATNKVSEPTVKSVEEDEPKEGETQRSELKEEEETSQSETEPSPKLKRASLAAIEVLPKSELRSILLTRSGSDSSLPSVQPTHPESRSPSRNPTALSRSEDVSNAGPLPDEEAVAEHSPQQHPTEPSNSPIEEPSPLLSFGDKEKGLPQDLDCSSSPPIPRRSSKRVSRVIKAATSPITPTKSGRQVLPFLHSKAAIKSSPEKPPETTLCTTSPSKSNEEQLEEKISSILDTIPARIRLASAPFRVPGKASAKDSPPTTGKDKEKEKDSDTLSISSHSTSSSNMTRSTTPTPSLTLTPAFARSSRTQTSGPDSDPAIKLYHLHRGGAAGKDAAPIQLFVRLVGENGERVMVRVGGGWADLGEYLREYALHHGRRSLSDGRFEVQGLPNNNNNSSPVPASNGNGTRPNQPSSRPTSAMDTRSTSALGLRKTRRPSGFDLPSDADVSTPSPPNSSPPPPVPSIPYRHRKSSLSSISTPPAANTAQDPPLPSSNTNTPLGLAGPKSKSRNTSLSAESEAWVEGMMGQARRTSSYNASPNTNTSSDKPKQLPTPSQRRASFRPPSRTIVRDGEGEGRSPVESAGRGFGDMGRVGGTRRVFLKGRGRVGSGTGTGTGRREGE